MSKTPPLGDAQAPKRAARAARLAQALRENLQKRKEQARAKAEADPEPATSGDDRALEPRRRLQ